MWLVMHGPTFEHLVPIIDDGVASLRRAGFGDRTGMAYSAILTVAGVDERLVHADDGPRDHAQIVRDFERIGADSPGVRTLKDMIAGFTAESAQEASEDYYRFVIDTVLAGLERLLDED